MASPHERDIAAWLAALALRCEPRRQENLEVLTLDYAGSLTDLPYEAFSVASREAASRKFERFPSFKALRKFLEEWADRNIKPKSVLLIDGPDDPSLDANDKASVALWQKWRRAGAFGTSDRQALGVMRSHLPRAYDYVIRTDPVAERIAMQHGWLHDASEFVKTDEQRAAVSATVREARDAIRAKAGSRWTEPEAPEGDWTQRRTRADDMAELRALDANPALPNRDQRRDALYAKLKREEAPPADDRWGGA